ncbi:MAG: alpha/beta hydrolase [Nanohaloarchaea archaeon SW_10_44_10]|nr:MAG: alpha/beta hydrolase [Nanohaloarchaea archaeon SW_10_44_10]
MTEKHLIEIEENEKVSTVHHESGSDKWIFFCHGFGSDKEGSYKIRCERAVEEGWNAVRFDFRGNGESDGDFIDQNLSSKMNDLKAVIDFFEPESYVLFGMSFGGKVVFHSAPELEPEAVIGKSPVTYNEIMDKFRSVVEEKGEYTHFGDKTIDHRFVDDLEENKFGEVTEQLEVPVAFYHGREDTTVHPEYTWEAAQNLEKDTRVEMFEGEEHKMSDAANSRLLNSMFQWLESI